MWHIFTIHFCWLQIKLQPYYGKNPDRRWCYVPRTVLSCSERRPPTATGLIPQTKDVWWLLGWAIYLKNHLFHVLWKNPLVLYILPNCGQTMLSTKNLPKIKKEAGEFHQRLQIGGELKETRLLLKLPPKKTHFGSLLLKLLQRKEMP